MLQPPHGSPPPGSSFAALTEDERQRLFFFTLTYLAGAYLERAGLPADRDAARRLAFGRWLRHTGRLDDDICRSEGD